LARPVGSKFKSKDGIDTWSRLSAIANVKKRPITSRTNKSAATN